MSNMVDGINQTGQSRISAAACLLPSMFFLIFLAAMIVPYMLALLISGIFAFAASPAYQLLIGGVSMKTNRIKVIAVIACSLIMSNIAFCASISSAKQNSNDMAAITDRDPLVITDVSFSDIKGDSSIFLMSWKTNKPSDSQVEYGYSNNYGTSAALDSARVTSHTQVLSGLSKDTVYHYRVKSKDFSGNFAITGDYSFMTSRAK